MIKIKISDLFENLPVKKKITKKDLSNHGKFFVYSSQFEDNGKVGYLDEFMFNTEGETIITFGDHTKAIFLRNSPFSVLDNVKVLKLKDKYKDKVNINFIINNWKLKIPNLGYARHWKEAKEIFINFPENEENDFDLCSQEKNAEIFVTIKNMQDSLNDYIKKLEETKVEFSPTESYKEMKIKDIFDLSKKTNGSKFTKTFIEKNKGSIPVYGASKEKDYVGYGSIKDSLPKVKYFENCLTWNIDGSIGKVHYREEKFSLSEKVIPLILFDNLEDEILKLYLKYELEKEFAKKGFNFENKAGKTKIKDIIIKIPVKEDGSFDLKMQNKLANKYEKIEEIREMIKQELNSINSIKLNL